MARRSTTKPAQAAKAAEGQDTPAADAAGVAAAVTSPAPEGAAKDSAPADTTDGPAPDEGRKEPLDMAATDDPAAAEAVASIKPEETAMDSQIPDDTREKLLEAVSKLGPKVAPLLPEPMQIAIVQRFATAVSPIEHDGVHYRLGNPVPLTRDQFLTLRLAGAVADEDWDDLEEATALSV